MEKTVVDSAMEFVATVFGSELGFQKKATVFLEC